LLTLNNEMNLNFTLYVNIEQRHVLATIVIELCHIWPTKMKIQPEYKYIYIWQYIRIIQSTYCSLCSIYIWQ
jgi:hypothetical protein